MNGYRGSGRLDLTSQTSLEWTDTEIAKER